MQRILSTELGQVQSPDLSVVSPRTAAPPAGHELRAVSPRARGACAADTGRRRVPRHLAV